MARVRFDQLVEVYRHTQFGEDGVEARVSVASEGIADLLKQVEDDDAAEDSGLGLIDDLDKVQLGAEVRVNVDAPRTGLGILARDIDGLILGRSARLAEPDRYYLVDHAFANGDDPAPEDVQRYRTLLAVVKLFGEAATFVDNTKGELVFLKDGRVTIPVNFDVCDLRSLSIQDADRLLQHFDEELHRDQKLEILFETVVDLCRAQKADARFQFVLRNLADIADAVKTGFRLFASKFSYAKIRSELEDARIDYTQKIHKTVVDIQNQLLGIPVAAVVVASQMKAPTACGPELLVNSAILTGAWVFVILLGVALVNQWVTLGVIKDEIERQKKGLLTDFPKVSDDFVGMFTSLKRRIVAHHVGLAIVGVIGLGGALMATCFHYKIASMPPAPCAASLASNTVSPILAPRLARTPAKSASVAKNTTATGVTGSNLTGPRGDAPAADSSDKTGIGQK